MPTETTPEEPPRRPRLTPPIANTRRAVRALLERTPAFAELLKPLALVALSGGPDSLALAAATAFEAPRAGWRAGAVIVDHGLQARSSDIAAQAAAQARALGLEPVEIVRVHVDLTDGSGPEASARAARHRALDAAATRHGATLTLFGHTLDDQAETVLLGLARGSGAASLSGMAPLAGRVARPFLGIRRAETVQACLDAGLTAWADPHNTDSQYTRVRVRTRVLPVLEAELGPGIAEALARTAEQLREDEAAFADQIDEWIEDICEPAEAGIKVSVGALAANPAALRQRVIRHVVLSEFGVSLSRAQTLDVARLVTDWRGQGPIFLPTGATARRESGWLIVQAGSPAHSAPETS
ncbi:MAG TPA: tRNA lysidine(34) synthetase TilS [Candidatus Lumbricidophila sp.]|nr:tRNA lysidine(34) synthetase TilS [Candidatus Lumbricidophila sp.]